MTSWKSPFEIQSRLIEIHRNSESARQRITRTLIPPLSSALSSLSTTPYREVRGVDRRVGIIRLRRAHAATQVNTRGHQGGAAEAKEEEQEGWKVAEECAGEVCGRRPRWIQVTPSWPMMLGVARARANPAGHLALRRSFALSNYRRSSRGAARRDRNASIPQPPRGGKGGSSYEDHPSINLLEKEKPKRKSSFPSKKRAASFSIARTHRAWRFRAELFLSIRGNFTKSFSPLAESRRGKMEENGSLSLSLYTPLTRNNTRLHLANVSAGKCVIALGRRAAMKLYFSRLYRTRVLSSP